MIWESKFLYYLQNNVRSDVMDKLMIAISSMADNGIVFIVFCVVVALVPSVLMPGHGKISYMTLTSLVVNALVCNLVLKPVFARLRPFERYGFITSVLEKLPEDFSFPSGHTSASFAFATTVFMYNRILGIIAYIYALLVAFSRMYLGVHYPTDVAAGIALGSIVALFCNRYALEFYKQLSQLL